MKKDVEALRWDVYRRDMGCIAPRVDPDAGPCYDAWGKPIRPEQADWSVGEMDYVRLESHGKHHELLIDHAWVCPGHHRGTGPSAGYQWATSHRRQMREWLEEQTAT